MMYIDRRYSYENNNDISNLVKELRYKLELTQEQFAQKVGVTFSTINNWGKRNWTPQLFLFQRLLEIVEEAGLKNIEDIKRTKK